MIEWSNIVPIITGALGAIGVIVVQWLKNRASGREHDIKAALHEQAQDNVHEIIMKRLDDIEKKLDIHNGYAQKFADTTNAITAIQKDIEYMKKGER